MKFYHVGVGPTLKEQLVSTAYSLLVTRKLDSNSPVTGVARGGLRGLGPQRMRKNIKASLVNLTLNMRYKN